MTESSPRRKPPAALVRLTTPLARRLAGHRVFPVWGVVHHRGRRTGRAYAVPVAVLASPTTIVIGLPWGTSTNWAQNVLAAGGCTLTWKGLDHHLTEPRLVDRAAAREVAASWQRPLLERMPITDFLQLHR